MVSKVFPCRGDLLSVGVSSRIPLVLGFPFWDSRAFSAMSDRDLRSRTLTMSFSDGLSMSVGSSLYRPNNSNPAGPLPQAHQTYILSSSVAPFTPRVRHLRTKEPWGDDTRVRA